MSENTLLFELLCEELPPASQKQMSDFLATEIFNQLKQNKFTLTNADLKIYSTPRRIGFKISHIANQSPDELTEIKLMPKKIGWVEDQASAPMIKKLESLNLLDLKDSLDNFIIRDDVLYAKKNIEGVHLVDFMQKELNQVLKRMPIEKVMSYQLADGWTSVNFARPAINLICMHGGEILDIEILGLKANNFVHGHRFESIDTISLKNADQYERMLEEKGNVIPQFDKRYDEIQNQISCLINNLGDNFSCPTDNELLEEVTTLVEKPNALLGSFDSQFLDIPSECLILSMKSNQKYFPVLKDNQLTNKFILISNIKPKDPSLVVKGNEKVIYPRLADAEFFFSQDKKRSLTSMVSDLDNIVYHQKLGSLNERCLRVSKIFNYIKENTTLHSNHNSVHLAQLAKADLSSLMVGEFPELQGIMGKYYALSSNMDEDFAQAIEDHYKPKFSGDKLPQNDSSILLSLADKFVTLIDLFSIGEKPSGVKDPFALRRAAISIIRILIECDINLDLIELINKNFPSDQEENKDYLIDFIFDRLQNFIKDRGYETLVVQSVCDSQPRLINDIILKVEAVNEFKKIDISENLAQSNKRVLNILKKYENSLTEKVNQDLLESDSEKLLYQSILKVTENNKIFLEAKNYKSLLNNLIHLSEPIDKFFEDTMVNADNKNIKHNRHLLLSDLNKAMNIIANLSVLGT